MTKKDYNRAKLIMDEISELKTQIKHLPRMIEFPIAYKESNQRCGYMKRILTKIKKKYYVHMPSIYISDYDRYECICELSEEDLAALVKIRKDKIAALEREMQRIGEKQEA